MKSSFLETIKSVDGRIFNIAYHQKRYENVLKSYKIDDCKDLFEYLKPPKKGTYRCRLVYDINDMDSIVITYHKYEKRSIESLKIVYDENIEYSKKYSDRKELDNLYKHRDKCDDILIVKNSLITDTSIANIAFFRDGIWITPAQPLLRGTTRKRYLDNAKIVESDIKVEELYSFSKVALLNAMIDFDIIQNISFKN